MQKIAPSCLTISFVILSCFFTEVQGQSACKVGSGPRFSRDSVYGIIESLELKNTDVVVIIADEDSLAQKLYGVSSVKELIISIKDNDACEDFERMLSEEGDASLPHTRVMCGGIEVVDLSTATAIIVTALDVDLVSLAKRVTMLSDGVKLLVREQVEYDQNLYLSAIRTIAVSATQGITMYEYVVKHPSAADLLNDLYVGMTGFGISQDEADVIRQAGGDPTYGEIELASAEKIFTSLVPVGPDDVFYDLGCGIGKLTLWIYLATPAKKSVGIELCGSRFASAEKAKVLMKEKIVPKHRPIMLAQWGDKVSRKVVEVLCGNIADADLRDATIIYMCATCYPDELMKTMVDKFVTLKEGLRIVTLKELPDHPSIHVVGTPQRFPMTWSHERGSPVYIYEMRHPALKDVVDKVYQATETGADEFAYDFYKQLLKNVLKLTSQDIFYDLGCGAGKVAMQAYLDTPVGRVVGIERSKANFEAAENAKLTMKEVLEKSPYDALWSKQENADQKVLEFRNEDIFESSVTDATKIFIHSTYLNDEVSDKIANFCKKLSLRVRVVTLKKLDACPELRLVKTHTIKDGDKKVAVYEYGAGTEDVSSKSKRVTPSKTNKKAK